MKSLNISSSIFGIKISPIIILIIILMLLFPLFYGDGYILRIAVTSIIMGILGMGFDFSNGFINIVNFGYAAFMGIGAYASGIIATNFGLSPWITVIPAVLITGLVGFLLGLLTLRLRGIFAACMAWFLALVVHSLAVNWVDLTRGSSGLIVPRLFFTASNIPFYYVVIGLAIISYIILRFFINSQMGFAFSAIGQDLEASHASGVQSTKYKIINFTISCAIAGLAGWFYAHYFRILTPDVTHTSQTVEILAVSYIGGRGSLWGSFVSALTVFPLLELLRPIPELRLFVYGFLLILVMIYYPGGLAELLSSANSKINEFFAGHRQIEGDENKNA